MITAEVINSDCRVYLSDCWASFDFIFADPPFNIGEEYDGYEDKMSDLAYARFTEDWIDLCWRKLKPGCAMMIHGSPKVNQFFYQAFAQLNLFDYIETEIIWAYNFGQCNFNNWIQSHCRATVLRKPGERKWFVENVLIESKRLRMGDKRVESSRYKGMVPPGTVWGLATNDDQLVIEPTEPQERWGRVQGNNAERRKAHPNQLPERYLIRAIGAYTQPGDLVFDPFGGSGTTSTVAHSLSRHSITTDISAANCESIKERIQIGIKI